LSAARVELPAPPPLKAAKSDSEHLHALSLLALAPERATEAVEYFSELSDAERNQLLGLAQSHHVVVRALQAFLREAGDKHPLARWTAGVLATEHSRITSALDRLHCICAELESHGVPVVVIKTLDHWPDFGSDIDLYTSAPAGELLRVMEERLGAQREPRSWGDRLAGKWNFRVPGLHELLEAHVQRLGQTGEHRRLGGRVISRRRPQRINLGSRNDGCQYMAVGRAGGYSFLAPAAEERVIIATLQRMYRHFYFRICDVANTAAMADSGALDYAELEHAASAAGIWPGVATYLKIASDYSEGYRGRSFGLPQNVLQAAEFGGETLTVRARFLRVPMLPQGASLYTQQVTQTALRGDVPATFRLSLLPPLASAAALAYRITGSDKGIW
jgi:hypothetical protein